LRHISDENLTFSGSITGDPITWSPAAKSTEESPASLRRGNYFLQRIDQHAGIAPDVQLDVEEQPRRVRRAQLAVINIGDAFTTGPEEAAFAMNELVRPNSVIPSHANEVATSGGKVIPGTRTANFLDLLKMPGYVPLSGRAM